MASFVFIADTEVVMPIIVYLLRSDKPFFGARPAAWGISFALHVVVLVIAQWAINVFWF